MTKLTVGEKIFIARREAKLSQADLAAAIDIAARTLIRFEKGETQPNAFRLKQIAQATGKPLSYFLGEDVPETGWKNTETVGSPITKVPVISWVSANRFLDMADPLPPGLAEEWVHTTNKGGNMFALKIVNDCMLPEFQEGEIIIIRPNISPDNGDFVVVRDSKKNTATFKQYKKYGDRVVLHPLNPKYDDIELDHDERYEIIGKVVEKVKKY